MKKNILSIFGILFALAIPLLIYAAPHLGQKELISNLDLSLPFWLYLVQFVVCLGLAASLAKDFKEWVKPLITLRPLLPMFAVAALAIFVCLAWIEPRHRVQSDESIFLSIAQNMYSNQIAGSCDEGEFAENGYFKSKLDCQKSVHNFKTKGESFLYALGIPILGNDLRWVFHLHIFLLLATIFLLYFAVRAWTANNNLAFLTSAIFAAQPTTLFQFRATSVEPLYALLFALCVFLLKWAWDKNTIRHWILLALAIAFFAQTRQETVFCLGAFVVFAYYRICMGNGSQGSKVLNRIPKFEFSIFLLAISFFCIPVLLTISYYQGYNFQGGEFNAHGHFFSNIKQAWDTTVNTKPDKGILINPFLSSFSVLALCGFILLAILSINELQSERKKSAPKQFPILAFLLLYFPQFFMIFENVSGDLTIEINQRYTLVIFPMMAFLCAFAIDKASGNRFIFALAVAAILWGNTLRYSESFKKNIMYNRNHLTTEEAEIIKWLDKEPEKERIFIYSRPWHFVGYGMNAIHYTSIDHSRLKNLLKKYNGEVYYVRGLDCWDSQTYHKKAIENRIFSVCDRFEQIFSMDLVFSTVITNNYRLLVAKLTGGDAGSFNAQEVNIDLPENAEWLGATADYNQDWGTLQIDKSVANKPLTIAKKRYKKGIGSHANGQLRYNLGGKYSKLTAVIGIDEAEFCSNGIKVKVLGDGKILADTGVLGQGKEYLLNVPLNDINQLVFEMDGLGDIGCDHVNIAIPVLYVQEL
jgi:hypothetical protein